MIDTEPFFIQTHYGEGENGSDIYQSIFPESLAPLSQLHGTREDAETYIKEVETCLLDGDSDPYEVLERIAFMEATNA